MAATKSVTMETDSGLDKYDFTWKIKNFSRYDDLIESAAFTPLSNIKTQFAVVLRYGVLETNIMAVPVCRILLKKLIEEETSFKLKVNFNMKFTTADDSVLGEKKMTCEIFNNELLLDRRTRIRYNANDCFNWSFFSKEKPIDDTLIVTIQFEFYGHNVTAKLNTSIPTKPIRQNASALSTDLKNLYSSKALTDIKIRVDDTVLQAHQAVLVARSPVFKRMLESPCLESQSKCLTITDADSEVFDSFLKYLYSGIVEDNTNLSAYNLYSMADKYEVPSLQEDCASILASSLNAENIWSVLKLSYLHSDNSLQDKAVCFVSSCFSEIKSSPEWKEIVKNYPELASEVLGYITAGYKN